MAHELPEPEVVEKDTDAPWGRCKDGTPRRKPGRRSRADGGKYPATRETREIDWGIVQRLAMIHCTQKEICSVLEISENHFRKRCEKDLGESWQQFVGRYEDQGKANLRRRLWKLVEDGSVPTTIFMAKNLLGMSDRFEQSVTAGSTEVQIIKIGNKEIKF